MADLGDLEAFIAKGMASATNLQPPFGFGNVAGGVSVRGNVAAMKDGIGRSTGIAE